ncbi:tetratricopeptide repeat-containing sulfotransferase family protein [Asticcacaulis taihuensis]|uniref:tetratricopeptide repeat-containing sulfotransferase family protein n=1 Tax=Asticcacaulis taihuensis TaxID=260084 RepID=UPI0026EE32C0|nr:tetratricopeptide repeat-containing sulfotransferase family protein [Asticcacaulis taihuensis]
MPTATHGAFALNDARNALKHGNASVAFTAAREATAYDPDDIEAWYLLGSAAAALHEYDVAEQAFDEGAHRAPDKTPTKAQMLTLRAQPLMAAGRPSDAVATLRAALQIGIPDAIGLALASVTLTHAGLPKEAHSLAEKAVTLNPRHADAWFNLGGIRQFMGDTKGAQAAYETAISTSGGRMVAAHHALARLRKWSAAENHIARLEALQCRDGKEACSVGYALFKEYDDTGDTDAAWDALQHAAMLARSAENWSPENEAALTTAWKQHLPPERFAARDERPRSGPRRIFIIGLPRSGTTLIERILTAHSQVQALGELKTIGIVVKRLSGVSGPGLLDPEVIAAAAELDPLDIAEAYTHETAYLHDDSAYTIDKLPNNHEYAGLIRLAFPDALIIGLDRNPMDALFGAYKLLFTGAHGWSYTQDDLAEHYDQFRNLMAHWKAVMGDGLIDVSLESLIADPDTQIRRLLDACGLPFEETCLSPHQAEGAITTASAGQVRRPINAEGIGAWRRYESQLAPLCARLTEMGYL